MNRDPVEVINFIPKKMMKDRREMYALTLKVFDDQAKGFYLRPIMPSLAAAMHRATELTTPERLGTIAPELIYSAPLETTIHLHTYLGSLAYEDGEEPCPPIKFFTIRQKYGDAAFDASKTLNLLLEDVQADFVSWVKSQDIPDEDFIDFGYLFVIILQELVGAGFSITKCTGAETFIATLYQADALVEITCDYKALTTLMKDINTFIKSGENK